jgi:hypothetical protein
MILRTCVTPRGTFRYAVHEPSYLVRNLRGDARVEALGHLPDGSVIDNGANFPNGGVEVEGAKPVYEIPNAFPFRGTTYIDSSWADERSRDPGTIGLAPPPRLSLGAVLEEWAEASDMNGRLAQTLLHKLPDPLLLALATSSNDPRDLVRLAELSCGLEHDGEGTPTGMLFEPGRDGMPRPAIRNHDLFEAVANNPALPDSYKRVMVLRPGAQGTSPIVGEHESGRTHVYEYLRENSYIPWGHYAANFADDAVRYDAGRLSREDMRGLRHLYYQRTYLRLADEAGVAVLEGRPLTAAELETVRQKVCRSFAAGECPGGGRCSSASLWGWNFGFDFAPSSYRLHASHQQIHQQYALVPSRLEARESGRGDAGQFVPYSSGDLVGAVVREYRLQTGQSFFDDYLRAVRTNTRTDGGKGPESLIVHEDEHVLLFVPKAQVSQWELQLVTLGNAGNVLEADASCRDSLDRAMLLAVKALTALGARMITSIEFSKRFTDRSLDQRLLYSFLPKLPYSPGAFSEAQLRFICGHYPEDFAAACRMALERSGSLGQG